MNMDGGDIIRHMAVEFYICIPVYNSEKFLDRCISSILGQNHMSWHLVLVDDGSVDSSGDICDRYAESDDRIRVIHQDNQGQIRARNNAVRTARQMSANGKADNVYVLFVDSDDRLKEGALDTLFKAIEENGYPDMVVYGSDKVSEAGILLERYDGSKYFHGTLTDRKDILKTVIAPVKPNYCSLWSKATRIGLFDGDGYDEELLDMRWGEDAIQSFELFCRSDSAVFLDSALYEYTINHKSVTHTLDFRKGIADTIRGNAYIGHLLESELTDAEMQPFYEDAADKLLSMISGPMVSTRLAEKEKLALLKSTAADDSCREYILCRQKRHRSLSLMAEGEYGKALRSIQMWSIGQFFLFAYLKTVRFISGRFRKSS